MQCTTIVAIATIGLLTLQCTELEALFLQNVVDHLTNRLESLKDRFEHHKRPEAVIEPSVLPEHPPTIDTTEDLPDLHLPEEGAVNGTVEVTTQASEGTTEGKRLIEVPLINGGCPAGYQRVGNRCREVFSGRRRRRR